MSASEQYVNAVEGASAPGAWTVSQVHAGLDAALAKAGMRQLWVLGTVSSLRRKKGFVSMELVEYQPDATTVRSVLPVGIFRQAAAEIDRVLAGAGVSLEDGVEIAVYGRLESNGAYGPLRMVALGVDPRVAVGAVVLARDELVRELQASGAMAAQRALVLPDVPRRIGLVSPAEGAGRADVIEVLRRSGHGFEVVEARAAMSGPTAPAQVTRALRGLCAKEVDVILLARGGGARSDLAPFDSPELARAVAACGVPVLTALGHATDRTVCDMVAHAAYPTPSAAAAALVARAEAKAREKQAAAVQVHQAEQLAVAHRRSRTAVLVAVVAVVVLVLVVFALAG
jgi:exodeoxyribonuclease VII large subunit